MVRELRDAAGVADVTVVPLPEPRTFEGAAYDQAGHISFWQYTVDSWRRIGASTYPTTPTLGPVHFSVTGGVLGGMAHATFVLTGTFTTDNSLNAIAYTADRSGRWGAIKAEPGSSNIAPSGQGITGDRLGLANGFAFVDGLLETADCSSTLPMYQCAGNQRVLKYWAWNGTDFSLTRAAGLAR